MKSNGIDLGISNGLVSVRPLVGSANGMQNSEQNISDINTFIFTVRTTANKTIVLPLVSTGTYRFWVDWGDGNKDFVRAFSQVYSGETAVRTHTYSLGLKDYTIKITGICRGWSYVAFVSEQPKLRSIQQFGCLELIDDFVNNGQQFANCVNLDLSNVKDTLSTKFLTSFYVLLSTCPNIGNVNLINNWNVRNITDMTALFFNDTSFNAPIGNWDVSNVTNMLQMFSGASAFNQPIDNWNLSSLTTTNQMFSFASSFNQPIEIWDVSKVINMSFMFRGANSFNQPLNAWNVVNVTDMGSTFNTTPNFNQPLNAWNVSNVIDMSRMFLSATAFNQPIGSWNVSSATNMLNMFNGANIFNQPIDSWNVSAVTNMSGMFQNATNFNQNIGAWNIGAVTNFVNFMSGKTPATFSTANLDAIYNGWSSRPSQSNLSISFGTAKYTSASSAGRAILVGRGWTIIDGGI